MKNFNLYSKYYDLLYKNKKYKDECNYILTQVAKHGIKPKLILELGSGTGSHARYFCKKNNKVIGVELSEEMVKLAKDKKIVGYEPTVGDIRNFKINKKFNLIVSLFHVISYINDNASLVHSFKNIANHLTKGGLFVFDVWYAPGVLNLKAEPKIKIIENSKLKITRFADPIFSLNDNVITVKYDILIHDKFNKTFNTIQELHPMRYFSIPEIDILAKLTGFTIVRVEELVTGKNINIDNWGACFFLKKN